ncbi:MAG: SAM-dependent methyltransferase [Planctomycetota bacterium]|jgi:SAM-dependent methyltransferase
MSIKEQIKRIPVFGNVAMQVYWKIKGNRSKPEPFPGSSEYWEKRYASGGNSGVGSYKNFAAFKAEILNAFVVKHDVKSVIEFGCGDGNQLLLANYAAYIGFDVSHTVIDSCKAKFLTDASKTFKQMAEYDGETADLSLSLDVIYHLVEDDIFENYMRALFKSANRYVIIYASDSEENEGYEGTHVRHRKFTKWIKENISNCKLIQHIANKYPYEGDYTRGSFADFYVYEIA